MDRARITALRDLYLHHDVEGDRAVVNFKTSAKEFKELLDFAENGLCPRGAFCQTEGVHTHDG